MEDTSPLVRPNNVPNTTRQIDFVRQYRWDLFISHASEDKADIALPLTSALKARGVRVWIDSHQLAPGDSLRRKIDEGLRESQFGVVILSKWFFRKEWTQKELDALVGREIGKEKVIIPVWHGVTSADVRQHSPLLADKVAITDTGDIHVLVNAIRRAIGDADERLTEDRIDELASTLDGSFEEPRKAALEVLVRLLSGSNVVESTRAAQILGRISKNTDHPESGSASKALSDLRDAQLVAREAEATTNIFGELGKHGNGVCPQCGWSLRPTYRGPGDYSVTRCEHCDYVDAFY